MAIPMETKLNKNAVSKKTDYLLDPSIQQHHNPINTPLHIREAKNKFFHRFTVTNERYINDVLMILYMEYNKCNIFDFSFSRASSQVLLSLKYSDEICFVIFRGKKVLVLLLQHPAFEIGHT